MEVLCFYVALGILESVLSRVVTTKALCWANNPKARIVRAASKGLFSVKLNLSLNSGYAFMIFLCPATPNKHKNTRCNNKKVESCLKV